jgi:hypothetical protein
MKKTILAIAAAATVAVGTQSVPPAADARCRFNCGLAIGLGAAVVGGAIIANSQPRYYAPEPGYVVYDGYRTRFPYDCPGGYWARKPIAFNAYGEPIRWSRPRPVCP